MVAFSMKTIFYNWSGGMESSAMLYVERERIRDLKAIICFADTGKQFPELYQSKKQVETILGIEIKTVPRRITFDEFLFERGGMIRKGTNDCSRRMKRSNLKRFHDGFAMPQEVNIGFNAEEQLRGDDFKDRNDSPGREYRFPLQEFGITRARTTAICKEAGFSIVLEMYRKMGRMDCFMCGNQSSAQALKVVDHYPELAAEWLEMEERKGHSFLSIPLAVLIRERDRQGNLFEKSKCACFGGSDMV